MPTHPSHTDVAAELATLEALRNPPAKGSHQSARSCSRYVARGEATLYPMSRRSLDDAGVPVFLRDIGRGGVGFICNRDLPKYSDWRIVFMRDGYAIAESALTVRHSERVRDSVYLFGGAFVANAGLLTLLGVAPHALENEYAGLDPAPGSGSVDDTLPNDQKAA